MSNSRIRGSLVWLVLAGSLAAQTACGSEPPPTRRPGPGGSAGNGWAQNPTGVAGTSPSLGFAGQSGPGLAGTGSSFPQPGGPNTMKPDNVCEIVRLVAAPQTPDMMIVLDRSGSMTEGGRWQPSVSAVRRVTTELESKIRFGLAMFPDPKLTDIGMTVTNALDCFNQPDIQKCLDEFNNIQVSVCAPGNVIVPVAPMNAMPIGQALSATQPNGGTPTSETLQKLVDTFANAPMSPDDMGAHAKYVLLVTDGQPTCPAGRGEETTPADIEASNAAIEALLAKDVRTYVIGYDTTSAGNEQLAQVLDGFATRGGTGAMKHTPVEDEASLITALQAITGQVVGCSFTLDKPPSRADFVLVKLDGQQVNLDSPDGWKLVGDRTIELTGKACAQFMSAGAHTLDAEVQCSVVGPA